MRAPLAEFYTLTELSIELVTMRELSGEKDTESTSCACPINEVTTLPDTQLKTLTTASDAMGR